ncbi:DUF6314 family protein [Larsenimonas suaedae]|uniref:DUF6314 family protein n=1 Tax=Larsenimonas suaedae TaxID=1851019 RepID=A0ABU1GXJ5_9GAMM|nr:DUF6314 family protein [Larsenimonas suaedae]MCM2971519.1 DUF6314 family protein [Larsenimonas suaedae]MDR5896775.1 DUF6314 family protein [Larsenimonas suaedae]
MTAIIRAWNALTSVTAYRMRSEPAAQSTSGWHGEGKGQVRTQLNEAGAVLHFFEQGTFKPAQTQSIKSRNVFRWELNDHHLALYHERRGPENAVFLFDLMAVSDHSLQTRSPHLCGQDVYDATLTLHDTHLELIWSISGPRKSERLVYRYQCL